MGNTGSGLCRKTEPAFVLPRNSRISRRLDAKSKALKAIARDQDKIIYGSMHTHASSIYSSNNLPKTRPNSDTEKAPTAPNDTEKAL